MAKNENIVSYSTEDIKAMLASGENRTDWARVDAKTDADLAADTRNDPAWDSVGDTWIETATAINDALVRPSGNKKQVTMRFDTDVLDYFKRGGRGWQGRMNAVLRSYMKQRA